MDIKKKRRRRDKRPGHLTTTDIYTANKNVKRCSTSLDIREIQIKTTRICATSMYMAKKCQHVKYC